jgi:hypothetical protein
MQLVIVEGRKIGIIPRSCIDITSIDANGHIRVKQACPTYPLNALQIPYACQMLTTGSSIIVNIIDGHGNLREGELTSCP